MGLFKKIIIAYKALKQVKDIFFQNFSNLSDHIDLSIKESFENLHHNLEENNIALEEKNKKKFKEMYVAYKNEGEHEDLIALFDCIIYGKITRKEYDEHNEKYRKFAEQKIKETDEGKISHQEFFETIYSLK